MRAKAAAAVRTWLYEKEAEPVIGWDYLQGTTIWWDYADRCVQAALDALNDGGGS